MIRTVRLSANLRRSMGAEVLALLGACNSSGELNYAQWKQMDPPPTLEVRRTPVVHTVNFEPDASDLSGAEAAALSEFLSTQELAQGEQIKVEAPSVGAADTERVAQRVEAVRSKIANQGIAVVINPPAAPGTLGADQVRVIASRIMAVNPDCPGYNQPVTYDRWSRPNLKMGCSNEINFGMMVADPHDLVRGRELAPADGEQTGVAIQRYRTGTTGQQQGGGASPITVIPMSMGSGSGGSGQ